MEKCTFGVPLEARGDGSSDVCNGQERAQNASTLVSGLNSTLQRLAALRHSLRWNLSTIGRQEEGLLLARSGLSVLTSSKWLKQATFVA